MLTFEEIRAAIILIKRAPLRGEESLVVATTLSKLERMAMAALNQAKQDDEEKDDDSGTSE